MGNVGAAVDIIQATELARQMITQFVMDPDAGLVTIPDRGSRAGVSQASLGKVYRGMKKIVDEAYADVCALITGHKGAFGRLIEAILERRTLSGGDIAEIAGLTGPGRFCWSSPKAELAMAAE
jgi:cell division protease FtsH